MVTIAVLIPTYRRPNDLECCLKALELQTRPADKVVLVVRDTDAGTWAFLQTFKAKLHLNLITVRVPGVVAALNAGLDAATEDIISITDDDAAPHTDWLARIETLFLSDERIGGVGGKDLIYLNGKLQDASVHPGASDIVGRLQWFGRTIGNHHIGSGGAREVDILKGVNMSYRRTAILNLRFDDRLKGAGAQVHNEIGFCLRLKRSGWKLIYDPAVVVDHFLAQRFDEDQRKAQFSYTACLNIAHNETLCLLEHLPPNRRLVYLLWGLFVGDRVSRGIIQLLRFLPAEKGTAVKHWLATVQGRWQGWQTWRGSRGKLEQNKSWS